MHSTYQIVGKYLKYYDTLSYFNLIRVAWDKRQIVEKTIAT